MDKPAQKRAWRSTLRARRARLSDAQRTEAEERMVRHFGDLPKAARTGRVLAYAAVPPEAPTGRLIETLWNAGAAVHLPRLDKKRPGHIDAVLVRDWSELVPGPYFGILQPSHHVPAAEPEALDAVVLPGVGFDASGRRLGQAGGYYDRLLAILPRRTLRIGWAFAVQFVEELPEEPHDQPVDVVVTEEGVTWFDDGWDADR